MSAALFDRFRKPPCADLLGWQFLDGTAACTRVAFDGKAAFLNPAGFVQGGILAAMLDDTMGPAALVASEGRFYTTTIGLNVSYLAPARPGPLLGEGRVVQLGKTIGFLEADLRDVTGAVVARATSQARLVPIDRLQG